jgi:hypothetical protein
MAEAAPMGPIEIMWTITGIMVPLLLGTAWAMIGLSPPEFWIARGAVLAAALILSVASIYWVSALSWPNVPCLLVAAAFGTAALIGFSECLRFINSREVLFAAQQNAASDKRAAIRTNLQQFYVDAGPIISRPLPKDISKEDFDKFVAEADQWVNETAMWIEENLGVAARERFLDRTGMLAMTDPSAANAVHNNVRQNLTRMRQNLQVLIENGAWDKN